MSTFGPAYSDLLKENVRGNGYPGEDVTAVYNLDQKIHQHANVRDRHSNYPKGAGTEPYTAMNVSQYNNHHLNHDGFTGGVESLMNKHIKDHNVRYVTHGENKNEMIADLPGGKQTYHVLVHTTKEDNPLAPPGHFHNVRTWFEDKPFPEF